MACSSTVDRESVRWQHCRFLLLLILKCIGRICQGVQEDEREVRNACVCMF